MAKKNQTRLFTSAILALVVALGFTFIHLTGELCVLFRCNGVWCMMCGV